MTIPNLKKITKTVISTIVLAIYTYTILYYQLISYPFYFHTFNFSAILVPCPGTHRENGPLREVFPELPPPRAPRKAPGAAKGAPQGVRDEDHALVALRLS